MKAWIFRSCAVLSLLALGLAQAPQGRPQTGQRAPDNAGAYNPGPAPSDDLATIRDPQTHEAVQAIQKLLEPVKAYKATVENRGLSLFANLTPSADELMGARPDKLRIDRLMDAPFLDGSPSKSRVSIVFDGTWTLVSSKSEPLTPAQHKVIEDYVKERSPDHATPAEMAKEVEDTIKRGGGPHYGKYNVKTLTEKGGEITIPQYLAGMGDLMHPFTQYRLDTLKLESETPEHWVFTGQCNYAMQPWAMTRLTIDKKTGFPTKLETDQNQFLQGRSRIPLGQLNTITLLNVTKLETLAELPEATFETKGPAAAPNDPEGSYVEDETEGQLMQLMERNYAVHQREHAAAAGQPPPGVIMPGRLDPSVFPSSTPAPRAVPTPASPPVSVQVITNSIGMKLALIPSGSFMMGSPPSEAGRQEEEGPVHKVTITQPFYMGIYEVTQAEWEKVMSANPDTPVNTSDVIAHELTRQFGGGATIARGPNMPVTLVAWRDAQKFCRALSDKEKATYRLPTEAEWEYACRAGSGTAYSWGDAFDPANAWINKNSGGAAHVVGTRAPNAWGLFDMSGNVSEWCADYMSGSYDPAAQFDPKGPQTGMIRVERGGSFADDAGAARSAQRIRFYAPDGGSPYIGLRVVREQ